MTKVECTKCGETVEITATVLVLPFVCGDCEAAMDKFHDDVDSAQQYEDMAPKSSVSGIAAQRGVFPAMSVDTKANLLKALANPAVQGQLQKNGEEIDYTAVAKMLEQTAELSDEFATVENTTLLIEDLEKQLVAVKNDRDELDCDNQRASQQIGWLDAERVKAIEARDEARDIAEFTQFVLSRALVVGREEIQRLEYNLQDEKNRIQIEKSELEMELFTANAKVGNAESRRDFWKNEAVTQRFLYEDLRSRFSVKVAGWFGHKYDTLVDAFYSVFDWLTDYND